MHPTLAAAGGSQEVESGHAVPTASGHVVPTVSVVMPTFNRATTLQDAIDPLLADPASLEVIVVDDGSSDGTRQLLESLASTHDRLRPIFVANGGAARARQIGVEAAEGDIVLVLDDDVIAAPGLVTGHAAVHAAHPGHLGIVVVGSMPTDLPPAGSRGTFATTIYASSYAEHVERWESRPADILHTFWMGNISLRREDALRVGLSGDVTGYHADRDFGLRCAKAGLTAVFDRRLAATHRHERSMRQFRADARSQGASAVALQRAHSDVAGGLDGLQPDAAGWVNRVIVAAGRRRRAAALVGAALATGVRAAGWLRAGTLERRGAYLLSRLEAARGREQAAGEMLRSAPTSAR